jgi:hypothetical protein
MRKKKTLATRDLLVQMTEGVCSKQALLVTRKVTNGRCSGRVDFGELQEEGEEGD